MTFMKKCFFAASLLLAMPAIAQPFGPLTFSGFPLTLGSTVINSGTTTTSIAGLTIAAGGGNTIAASTVTSSGNVAAGSASALLFTSRTALKSAQDGGLTIANAAGTNAAIISVPTAIATPTFQFGALDAAAPVAQTIGFQSVVAGTSNIAGANTIINLSRGTGTGIGGNLTINGSPHSTTGSTQNALSAVLTLNGDTLAAALGGTLTITTIGTGTGDFLCSPVAGGLVSQGVTTCVASDKRVKNDLGVVSPAQAVARVMSFPDEHLFSYKRGYGPSGDHTGWWAQDIQKIWPGIVYKGNPTKLTPDGELSLDRAEMGPDTTTAVKWLVGQVAALKAENASLRAANDNFNRRLSALEGRRKLANLK